MDNNQSNVTMLLHNVCELCFGLKHDTINGWSNCQRCLQVLFTTGWITRVFQTTVNINQI